MRGGDGRCQRPHHGIDGRALLEHGHDDGKFRGGNGHRSASCQASPIRTGIEHFGKELERGSGLVRDGGAIDFPRRAEPDRPVILDREPVRQLRHVSHGRLLLPPRRGVCARLHRAARVEH